MKGFLALVLALVPEATRRRLRVPLHLAFTHDEETGCFGAPALIGGLPVGIARPLLAIVGEPTSMQVANRQKGCSFFRTHVTGREGHSSAPERGVNAIVAASEIIAEIGRLAAEARSRGRPKTASTRRIRRCRWARSPVVPQSTSSPASAASSGICATFPTTTRWR